MILLFANSCIGSGKNIPRFWFRIFENTSDWLEYVFCIWSTICVPLPLCCFSVKQYGRNTARLSISYSEGYVIDMTKGFLKRIIVENREEKETQNQWCTKPPKSRNKSGISDLFGIWAQKSGTVPKVRNIVVYARKKSGMDPNRFKMSRKHVFHFNLGVIRF